MEKMFSNLNDVGVLISFRDSIATRRRRSLKLMGRRWYGQLRTGGERSSVDTLQLIDSIRTGHELLVEGDQHRRLEQNAPRWIEQSEHELTPRTGDSTGDEALDSRDVALIAQSGCSSLAGGSTTVSRNEPPPRR